MLEERPVLAPLVTQAAWFIIFFWHTSPFQLTPFGKKRKLSNNHGLAVPLGVVAHMLDRQTARNWFQGKSILFFWIISYFAVLIIMFFTFSITYNRSLALIEEQVSALNAHTLGGIQRDIDNKLSEKDAVFRGIVFNGTFASLLDAESTGTDTQYMVYRLWNELKTTMSPAGFGGTCYISFPHLGTVMSYDNSVYYGNLYESVMSGYGLPYETYMGLMTGEYTNDYTLLPAQSGGGRSILCYAHTVQFDRAKGHSANILFFFFADEIVAGLRTQSEFTDASSLMIAGAQGDSLIFFSDLQVDPDILADLPSDGRMTVVGAGASRLCISMLASTVSPLKYCIVAPYEAIFERVAFIRRFGFLGITLGMLLSLFCIALSLAKNYSPIRRLIGSLRQLPDGEDYRNEIDIIRNAIEHLQLQNHEQTDIIGEQTRLLDENALRGRLLGQPGARLSAGALVLDEGYRLALIACEAASGLEGDTSEIQQLGDMILAQLLAEALGGQGFLSVVHVENMMAVIVPLPSGEDTLPQALLQIGIILQQRYDTAAFIALSGIRHDFANIAYVYARLKDHIAYNQSTGDTSILILPDTQEAFSSRYTYPEQMERRLQNLVQLGEGEQSAALVRELFTYNMTTNKITFEAARGLSFAVLGTMVRALAGENPVEAETLLQEMNPYAKLSACTDAASLQRRIEKTLAAFCAVTAQSRKIGGREGGELVERVNRFIAENIANPGLNLTMIADHFGLTAPYLSTLYSNATGIRLLDSINLSRIVEVKRLLADGLLPIDRVAERAGFSGAKTLTRVFKKYEGITPGEFREMHRNKA